MTRANESAKEKERNKIMRTPKHANVLYLCEMCTVSMYTTESCIYIHSIGMMMILYIEDVFIHLYIGISIIIIYTLYRVYIAYCIVYTFGIFPFCVCKRFSIPDYSRVSTMKYNVTSECQQCKFYWSICCICVWAMKNCLLPFEFIEDFCLFWWHVFIISVSVPDFLAGELLRYDLLYQSNKKWIKYFLIKRLFAFNFGQCEIFMHHINCTISAAIITAANEENFII